MSNDVKPFKNAMEIVLDHTTIALKAMKDKDYLLAVNSFWTAESYMPRKCPLLTEEFDRMKETAYGALMEESRELAKCTAGADREVALVRAQDYEKKARTIRERRESQQV